jgi:hypothetical protein
MGKLLSGAVVVPRVEGFRAPYATGEQHRKPLIIYSVHLHFPEFRRTSPLLSNRILNGAIFDGSKLNRGSSRNQNFRPSLQSTTGCHPLINSCGASLSSEPIC